MSEERGGKGGGRGCNLISQALPFRGERRFAEIRGAGIDRTTVKYDPKKFDFRNVSKM